MISHDGRMYELFYWLSRGTDWMPENNKIKQWIENKERHHWWKWIMN